MATEVFVVIVEDRHSDTEVEVWTDLEKAIDRAKSVAHEYDRHGDYAEGEIPGWEFHAVYSCEGDSVRVVRKDLQ